MVNSVEFQEVVFAAITRNLEFRTEPNGGAGFFGLGYGFLDLLCVAIEIHRPLIEIACCNLQEPHRVTEALLVRNLGFLNATDYNCNENHKGLFNLYSVLRT